MSVLNPAVDEAVAPALATAIPGIVTGYFLVASYMDRDGEEHLALAAPRDQRVMVTSELAAVGGEVVGMLVSRYIEETFGDDE